MPDKNKGVTGHDDLDAHIDKVLAKHGGSIKPSDSGWNRVHNLIAQGQKRDAEAKAKKAPQSPAPKTLKRGKK
jgi:hypothetical protein